MADKLPSLLVAIFLIIWVIGKRKKLFNYDLLYIPFVSAIFSRFVVVEFIRLFYNRPRPFESLNVNQLLEHSIGNSFPSGHASFFFALATAVYFYNKKAGTWFLVGAGLISFSRVYVGIHYPLDVIVGALIGVFVSWLTIFYFKKYFSHKLDI